MKTVLVAGATGNVGRHVVRELTARGTGVRALVRDESRAAAVLGPDADLAVGDFEDPRAIEAALDGMAGLFLSSASGPRQVEHESAVIDAAVSAGTPLVVKLSTMGARPGSPLPGLDWHGRIEEHLDRSGLPAVILQANFLMSNLFASAGTIRDDGTIHAPAGTGRVSVVDPRDVAAAAAAVLTSDGAPRHRYVLTGPVALSYDDLAAELSLATGRTVTFVDTPEEAARQSLAQAGLPGWLVTHLLGAFALIRDGALAEVSRSTYALTGRVPRTFADFARDNVAAFIPPVPG